MSEFNKWLDALTEDLTEGKDDDEELTSFPCCVCGEDTDIECDPKNFDPDHHYCGRSSHCCP